MEFPDVPFLRGSKSYPSHETVWSYLNFYAGNFKLKKHINYLHLVEHVRLNKFGRWDVSFKDLVTNATDTKVYDVVFVCTGVSSSPHMPKVKGSEKFNGKIIHSHDYRTPEAFSGAL